MKPGNFAAYGNVLLSSVVFKDLPEADIREIVSHGFTLDAVKGDLILYEHMKGGVGIYVVVTGLVEVLRLDASAPATEEGRHLGVLVPGDCLGEYSLIDGRETSASARALEDTTLFFLPRGAFQRIVERNPQSAATVYRNLLVYLIARLRRKNDAASRA